MNSDLLVFVCTTISWSCAKLSSRNTTTPNIEIHVMVRRLPAKLSAFSQRSAALPENGSSRASAAVEEDLRTVAHFLILILEFLLHID